jgi:flagellar M-ring protein FliF
VADPIDAAGQNATVLNLSGNAGAKAGSRANFAVAGLGGARSEAVNAFVERLKAMTLVQKLLVAGALLLVFLIIIFSLASDDRGGYKVLFSNLNDKDSAAIVASLQQKNIKYKFTEGGGAVMVPSDQVYETRLKLAGEGLPKSGYVGFELLENQKLGTSQFVEQVNYQRGLEGELAKSISALSTVESARVHLAVPKQSAFIREQQRPSASVVINLHPGRFLDQRQSISIAHLVSSSVPGMGAQDVTILDSEGNLLAPSPDRSAMGLDSSQLKYVQDLEAALSRRVSSILEPITGKGNVKAQVTLDMDFNELARAQEAFGRNTLPNEASVRSQQSIQMQGTAAGTGGIPGALTNQPPPNAQAPIDQPAVGQPIPGTATGPNTNANTGALNAPRVLNAPGTAGQTGQLRNELTTNFEVDRTIEYLKRAQGELRRVSAAVVVNYKPQTDPATGAVTPVPFTPQEVQQMLALARDAVGFRQDRGDSVSLANIPFTVEPSTALPFYKDPATVELAKEILKFATILAGLGLVFWFVVKPILFPPPKLAVAVPPPKLEDELDEKVKAELAMLTPEGREKRRLEMELRREKLRMEEEERKLAAEQKKLLEEEERRIAAERAENEYEDLIEYARAYVQSDPRVVSNVFKGWMMLDSKD